MTDQPDAQRGAGRADPDVEGSSWLASALSGRRTQEPATAGPSEPVTDETPGAHARAAAQAPAADHALSPLVPPALPTTPTGVVRWWTAGATLAATALLCVAAFAGTTALVVAALFVVGVTAWGWPRLVDSPSPRGSAGVVAAGGAASVLAVGLTEEEPLLQWLAFALAAAVVLEFVHQLARRDGRPRLVECVTATLAGVVVLASMSSWVALPRTDVGAGGVVVAVVPVAVALAMQAAPVPGRLASVGGVAASTVLGGLVAGLVPEPTVLAGLVTGLVAGAVGVMLHRLLAVLPPAGAAPAWLAVATAPLASTGLVGYVVLRLMVG